VSADVFFFTGSMDGFLKIFK